MSRNRLNLGSTHTHILLTSVIVIETLLAVGPSATAQDRDPLEQLEAVHSDLYDAQMVELKVNGTKAFIVKAKQPTTASPKPWIWYAPSLTAEDGTWKLPSQRHANVVKGLLKHGFYFCGVDVGESYGSPKGRETFTDFYNLLVNRYGFSLKACLFPVSRGGLMHYTWAVEHPQCVQCIGGIYPVCNLQSHSRLERISRAYGLTKKQMESEFDKHNPLSRLKPLAEAGVPILHLHGDADKVVPLKTHSAELARRFKQLGGNMEIVIIQGKGHELAPEYWENPRLPGFFLQHGTAPKRGAKAK